MSLPKATLSLFAMLLGGCTSAAPPVPGPPQPIALGEAEIGALAGVLRREDTRQYDYASFEEWLASPNATVRLFSVRALGRIGDRSATNPLVAALRDSVLRVRAEAAFALGE